MVLELDAKDTMVTYLLQPSQNKLPIDKTFARYGVTPPTLAVAIGYSVALTENAAFVESLVDDLRVLEMHMPDAVTELVQEAYVINL